MTINKLGAYVRLMRWHQLAGFYLILPSTLWGLVAAYHQYDSPQTTSSIAIMMSIYDGFDLANINLFVPTITQLGLIFIVGSLIMRSAGCIVNDYWDADIDPKVERTKTRPIASGELTKAEAMHLFIILIIVALALVLLLNPLTIALSIVGIIGTTLYPLAKRHIQVPQLVLGLVFSWGTVMAWSAVANDLWHWDVWLLWVTNIIWIVSYDLQYALCDLEDDKQIQINSGAIYFASSTAKVIVLLQVLLLALLAFRGWLSNSSPIYFMLLGGGALLFIYFYNYTKGYSDGRRCLTSFRRNHWFGWLILLGIIYN